MYIFVKERLTLFLKNLLMKGCTSDKERKERKKELLCNRINLLSNCTIFGKEAVLHT